MTIADTFGKRRRNGGQEVSTRIEPVPGFLTEGREDPLANLSAEYQQQKALPPATQLPAPSPIADPLHPLVAQLLSKGQINAAEKAREEARKSNAAMLAELQKHISDDAAWYDDMVEKVKLKAALSAALHVKLRTVYEAAAKAREEYDSPDLPVVPDAPATEEKPSDA